MLSLISMSINMYVVKNILGKQKVPIAGD